MKKSLATMLFATAFLAASNVNAISADEAFDMTVSQFQTRNKVEQADTINVSLNAIYNYYVGNKKKDQANCMVDLYKPAKEGDSSILMDRIVDGTFSAKPNQKVSDVIITVVEHSCSIPTEIVDAAPPTPGNT